MTPKLIELVEISHAPANFFYFVNQCNRASTRLVVEAEAELGNKLLLADADTLINYPNVAKYHFCVS